MEYVSFGSFLIARSFNIKEHTQFEQHFQALKVFFFVFCKIQLYLLEYIKIKIRHRLVNKNDDSLDRLYKCKFVFDKKKKFRISQYTAKLTFLWYDILVKKRVSAEEWQWMSFQKTL